MWTLGTTRATDNFVGYIVEQFLQFQMEKKKGLYFVTKKQYWSQHTQAMWNQHLKTKERTTLQAPLPTILCEFGRRKLCRNEERLFGATLEDEAGGNIRAAIVVFFAAGQAQVQGMVVKCAILITL